MKTTKLLAIVIMICALLSLCACKKEVPELPAPPVENPQPPAPPPVETPKPQPESITKKVLKDESGSELVKITIRLPKESGSPAFDQINTYFEAWLDDTLFYAESTLLSSAKQASKNADFKPFTLNADFTIARRDEAVYSIERSMDVMAGSDVQQRQMFETFSMENGGRLSIFDLWKADEGWQEVLWTELCAQAAQLTDTPPDFEAFPFDFSLTADGISIFRSLVLPDEAVPAMVRFDIFNNKITPLLQEKWIYLNDK